MEQAYVTLIYLKPSSDQRLKLARPGLNTRFPCCERSEL